MSQFTRKYRLLLNQSEGNEAVLSSRGTSRDSFSHTAQKLPRIQAVKPPRGMILIDHDYRSCTSNLIRSANEARVENLKITQARLATMKGSLKDTREIFLILNFLLPPPFLSHTHITRPFHLARNTSRAHNRKLIKSPDRPKPPWRRQKRHTPVLVDSTKSVVCALWHAATRVEPASIDEEVTRVPLGVPVRSTRTKECPLHFREGDLNFRRERKRGREGGKERD